MAIARAGGIPLPLLVALAHGGTNGQKEQAAASSPPLPSRAWLVGSTYARCEGMYERSADLIQGRSVWDRVSPNDPRFILIKSSHSAAPLPRAARALVPSLIEIVTPTTWAD